MVKHVLTEELSRIAESLPFDQAMTLEAQAYLGEGMGRIDREAIFSRYWQYVGHENQLSQVGDLLVTQIADKPILVVRKTEKEFAAYYNVCKHRAGPLATENGNVRNLRCRYHGWTYDLSGQLIVAPEMESSAGFNPCDIHLDSVAITTWQGLLFVSLAEQPESIDSVFSGIADKIQPIDLQSMAFHHRDEYVVNCHWKVYMDNYLEGYHLPYVHPGLSKLLDYRQYDTEIFDWYSYQSSPLQEQSNFYGQGAAHYFCIYPNMMLNILPDRCQVNLIEPLASNQCRVIFDYYYGDMASEQTQQMITQDLDFSDEIQIEDIEICEQVQGGLESGCYVKGPLCQKREVGVWHFQELLRRSYREWLAIDQ